VHHAGAVESDVESEVVVDARRTITGKKEVRANVGGAGIVS